MGRSKLDQSLSAFGGIAEFNTVEWLKCSNQVTLNLITSLKLFMGEPILLPLEQIENRLCITVFQKEYQNSKFCCATCQNNKTPAEELNFIHQGLDLTDELWYVDF